MPTITEKKNKFSDQDASQILRGGGGSPEGETTAPARSVRERLRSEVRGLLSDELVDELLAGARSEEEIVGPGGLLAGLTKRLVERAMEVELTGHLGYEHGQSPPGGAGNTRNGSTPKTLATEHGPVGTNHAAGSQRDVLSRGSCASVSGASRGRREDHRALLRGLSTRDIQAYLGRLYGVEVGRDLISRVTDAVMDDARAWATRPLDDVYPIVFLDCLVLKVREGGSVQPSRLLPRVGESAWDGERDVLGNVVPGDRGREVLDAGPHGAQAGGVQDILICCVDGLKGFPEAIEAIFPKTVVQTCIVHLIATA